MYKDTCLACFHMHQVAESNKSSNLGENMTIAIFGMHEQNVTQTYRLQVGGSNVPWRHHRCAHAGRNLLCVCADICACTDLPTDRPTCASSLDAASISNSPLPAVEAAQVNHVCAPEQPMQSGIRDPVLGLTAKARYQHRRR